jgi:hypothetical protein
MIMPYPEVVRVTKCTLSLADTFWGSNGSGLGACPPREPIPEHNRCDLRQQTPKTPRKPLPLAWSTRALPLQVVWFGVCGFPFPDKRQFNRVPLAAGLAFHPLQQLLSQPEVTH